MCGPFLASMGHGFKNNYRYLFSLFYNDFERNSNHGFKRKISKIFPIYLYNELWPPSFGALMQY